MTWTDIIKFKSKEKKVWHNDRNTVAHIRIKDNESVHSFATKVAEILENDYGRHNYETFINTLKERLG